MLAKWVSFLPLQRIKGDDDNLSDTPLTQGAEVRAVQLKSSKPCDGPCPVLFCYVIENLFSANLFLNLGKSQTYIQAHVHTYLQRTFLLFQIQQKHAKDRNVRIEDAYATFLCNYNTVPSWLI